MGRIAVTVKSVLALQLNLKRSRIIVGLSQKATGIAVQVGVKGGRVEYLGNSRLRR